MDAIIYTEDAPALKTTLHREFHRRRVIRVNERYAVTAGVASG